MSGRRGSTPPVLGKFAQYPSNPVPPMAIAVAGIPAAGTRQTQHLPSGRYDQHFPSGRYDPYDQHTAYQYPSFQHPSQFQFPGISQHHPPTFQYPQPMFQYPTPTPQSPVTPREPKSSTEPKSSIPNYRDPTLLMFCPETEEKYYHGEESLKQSILAALSPFGIEDFHLRRSLLNHDASTKAVFPHKGLAYVCKSCSKTERLVPITTEGCCGFEARISLKTNDNGPFLDITQFTLPVTSKHILVSQKTRESLPPAPFRQESQMSASQTELLKTLGATRLPAYEIREIMKKQYPELIIHDVLMYRVSNLGRKERVGGDEDSSLLLFLLG
mmetsp:Transcript_29566/g.62720  ORF Transcript_29566/g.62720 Transcript_29566/m.62720 type:complete len:328 (-) Transcript_29566:440-1423(-)